jgi:radical SAM protein with 4Fe4S-binding SPASM domain
MQVPSDTFCSMAWDHAFIDPTGRVKPCCRFAEKHRPKENNLQQKTLTEIWNGDWMKQFRADLLAGKQHPGCIRCYQEEDAGKISLRERYHANHDLPIDKLVDLENPRIRWIELAISNDCNLACRMCDSRYSWKWFEEEKLIYGKPHNKTEKSKSDIELIYPFIPDLTHVKFTGGEPLITPDHWTFLDRMIAERDCSEIFLNYSTNCTIMPKDEWIEKWLKFKYNEFALSFDSSDPLESEYIRYPAKYSTTEAVTKRFFELKREYPNKFRIFLRSTISIQNVWMMPESLEWWNENDPERSRMINPTHLTFPEHLAVTVLPLHLKQMVAEKFERFQRKWDHIGMIGSLEYIKNHMMSKDDTHLLPLLRHYLKITDQVRGQNFYDHFPQFSSIFDSLPEVETRTFSWKDMAN